MGRGVFANCTALTSAVVPASVEEVGALLFSECKSLAAVSWPLPTIPEGTFKGCTGLKTFEVPEGVTRICIDAFSECSLLVTLTLPGSLTTIDSGAFRNCDALREVYCYGETVPVLPYAFDADGIFENVPIDKATLHVPASAVGAYQTTAPWNGFGRIVAIN